MNTTQQEIQIVTFILDDQEFGLNILEVQEINKLTTVTKIPNSAGYIEGIINLRNKIIPIINLKKRMQFDNVDNINDKTARIIVVNINETIVGFIVDSVSEVLRISQETVEPLPDLINNVKSEYVKGVIRYNDRLLILIDLKKIIQEDQEQLLLE